MNFPELKTDNGQEWNLNEEQKEAVVFGDGPILIVAGAGTGKTTAIISRIANLIREGRAKPEEILAVTFTEKAAEEMEERVDKSLPYGYADLWISTFHSFCRKVLEENGLDIGLPTDFKLLDETAAWLLIKQNLDKFKLDYYKPRGNPSKFIHALISHFSHCKDQAIYPEDYLKYGKKVVGEDKNRIREVAEAYHDYQNLLLESGLFDFGDLINYCLKLFRERPLILEKYRKQFKYILVDEFQDTNWAQYELIKMLSAPKNNLTVSADDDQAIYRWRGASFGNIIQFKKDYPKAKEVVLTKNYRSLQNVLDSAYKFIQLNNPNRLEHINKINKRLLASRKGEGAIEHLHFKNSDQELQGIINKITDILKKDREANFSDFAVLTRTNDSANAFARACERAEIPYQFASSSGLYSKPIILDIISYFKILNNYHEDAAVCRILNLPFLKIFPEDIAKITQHSYKRFKSTYETLKELTLIQGLSASAISGANRILSLIKKHVKIASEKNVSEILLAFLEDSGYLKHIVEKKRKEDLDYINQFYSKIKRFEESNPDPSLKNFTEELNLELESGETGKIDFDFNQGPDMVKIMTVHTAKGLEFKYVFLINLVDRKFPTSKRRDPIEVPEKMIKDIVPEGDIHLEEERRLFYVAMTRAKNGLFFTSAEDYGGLRRKKLSQFLNELGYSKKITEARSGGIKIKKKKRKEKIILPNHFSFTQLSSFEKCPLQYKFAHILKIPGKGKAVFSFGSTMHNTLYNFIRQNSKEKIAFEKLLEIYQNNWIEEWYASKNQRDEYYQLGEKSLRSFYDNFLKEKPSVLQIKNHLALEQNFNLKMSGYTVNGKIDRIDKMDEGVEVIDYKTGNAKEELKETDKQQLLIYQIAAEEVFGLKPKRLTYYYLDEGKKLSFLGLEEDKKRQKEKIISQIKEIMNSDFAPKPGWDCRFCDFRDICEYAQKRKN